MNHLKAMTDDTGIFQHSNFCIPKRNEGYTTDDNARALVVCTIYYGLKKDSQIEKLARIYLAFLNHMQKPEGSFHNYLGYGRTFSDVDGSEESYGRSLWACGCVINSNLPKDVKMVAKDIFDKGLPWVWKSTWLRFYATTILGLTQYYQASEDNELRDSVEKLGDFIFQHYQDEAKDDWHWFEHCLTYDNARLTQAMFEAYGIVGKQEYLDAAKESMDFLLKTQMIDGVFVPIGNDGWFKHGGKRAFYDQQPLEAAALVEAAIDAYCVTKEKDYLQVADKAFEWFLGKNSRNVVVYDHVTGGCCDGLGTNKVNMNQGAESSVSYLLARLKLEECRRGFWKQKKRLD